MNIVKMFLAMIIVLGIISLLLSAFGLLEFVQGFTYTYFTLLAYGWWVYIPFVALYKFCVDHSPSSLWVSATIGGGLVLLFTVILWANILPFTPNLPLFSQSRGIDIFIFAIGGMIYGVLSRKWLTTAHTIA